MNFEEIIEKFLNNVKEKKRLQGKKMSDFEKRYRKQQGGRT